MVNINKLETKRLILRPLLKDDFSVFSNLINTDDVSDNLEFVLKRKEVVNIKDLFQSLMKTFNSYKGEFTLLIINKELGDTIGLCGLNTLEDSKEAECFYTLLPEYRGSGFAIEAMKKLIEYGFLKLALLKIIAYINPKKSALWKVAERVGMKYMGHKQIDAISSKAMYYSIDKYEFEAQKSY